MATKKILIVEDNPPIRMALERILFRSGYKVFTASDGVEAVNFLKSEIPDLIISDIMMPNMNGYDLYKKLRSDKRLNTVPFIFLTALSEDGDVRKGKELGIDDYITKPFNRDDVLSIVRGKLARRAQLEEGTKSELESLKKEIIMTLSHEFKTPLTVIQGFTALLLKDDMNTDQEQLKEFIKYIKTGGDRLSSFINDFISMLEIDSEILGNEVSLLVSNHHLNSVITSVLDKYKSETVKRSINISCELSSDLPLIKCPLKHISLAVEKVIQNAIKFAPPDRGFVKIRTFVSNGNVVAEIEDNGPGIPEEEFSNIFKKFYQINRQRTEQQGAGLGLTIARSYLEASSGKLTLKSEPGKGTIFILTLPSD